MEWLHLLECLWGVVSTRTYFSFSSGIISFGFGVSTSFSTFSDLFSSSRYDSAKKLVAYPSAEFSIFAIINSSKVLPSAFLIDSSTIWVSSKAFIICSDPLIAASWIGVFCYLFWKFKIRVYIEIGNLSFKNFNKILKHSTAFCFAHTWMTFRPP